MKAKWFVLLIFASMIFPKMAMAEEKAAPASDKGNIKLRVVAVNPSKEKSQKVPIKIYLPKEVIPDDIIDMGELQVGYDSDKGTYYAYSEGVELKPQETRVFEVQLEDVWKIPEKELDKVKLQTQRALKHLETTEHFQDAKAIVSTIEERLKVIVEKQNDESISREEHIGAYRMNRVSMENIQRDIAIIEKMLQHTGAPPSIEFLKDTVFEEKKSLDKITAWKLILAIMGFLGLLAGGFYVRWMLMIKNRGVSSKKQGDELAPLIPENVEDHTGVRPVETVPIENLSKGAKDKRQAG